MDQQADRKGRLAAALLLPLLLINITVSENDWYGFGIRLGQTSYWWIIAIAWYLTWHGPYRRLGTTALVLSFGLRSLEAATGSATVEMLRHGALALMFVVAGATAYGRAPKRLHRQFTVYFAVSLLIMVLQVTGAHSVVQSWNIDYAHDLKILSLEEVGTFKMIPVYPTLFVEHQDLFYRIGQARPPGLTYANNVLSVLVSLAMGINLGMATQARLRFSDVVLVAVTVLTMSLTASAAVMIVCVAIVLAGAGWRKRHVLKVLGVMAIMVWVYARVFPGLFVANLSESKLLGSIYTRGLQVFDALGLTFLRERFEREGSYLDGVVEADALYSGVAIILASPLVSVLLIAAPFLAVWYRRRVREMQQVTPTLAAASVTTGVMCVLTQFGVPYIGAPSFQVMLGFALLPLFPLIWRPNRPPPAGKPEEVAQS